jgi:hypothetical protein
MARRPPNYRLVKQNRTYSVEDVAVLFGTHRNTVRHWIKSGLKTIDARHPLLVHGGDLAHFLKERRAKTKHPCAPGQIYCLRCRLPRTPRDNAVVYRALTEDRGDLVGMCSVCGCGLFRRVSLAKLRASAGDLAIGITEPEGHIGKYPHPSLSCDFNKEPATHV